MAAHLREHPEVYMPRPELHFFNRHEAPEKNIDRYRAQFSQWAGEPQVGEKTPNYALMPNGPEKIEKVLPDAKLVWSFRNPVERSYSNYWHAVKRGREFRSFDAALAKEDERTDNGKRRPRGTLGRCYAMRSDYVDQIRRYLEHFDQDQMYYLLFEDLASEPEETMKGLMRFLEIDTAVETRPERHYHKTHLPRIKSAQYLAHQAFGKSRPFQTLARFNRKKTPGYPPMSEAAREKLRDRFQQWYPEFERLTGLSTDKWR